MFVGRTCELTLTHVEVEPVLEASTGEISVVHCWDFQGLSLSISSFASNSPRESAVLALLFCVRASESAEKLLYIFSPEWVCEIVFKLLSLLITAASARGIEFTDDFLLYIQDSRHLWLARLSQRDTRLATLIFSFHHLRSIGERILCFQLCNLLFSARQVAADLTLLWEIYIRYSICKNNVKVHCTHENVISNFKRHRTISFKYASTRQTDVSRDFARSDQKIERNWDVNLIIFVFFWGNTK